MTERRFVDTNVVVYAATGRIDEPFKHQRALNVLDIEGLCLSAQVLQEFFATVTRKPRVPLSRETAAEWVERLAVFPCAEIDSRTVKYAITLSQRYVINYWDAAILAAAERLGAEVVFTEDLNHGQVYGTVRVDNPFVSA